MRWMLTLTLVATGAASSYAPGVFERVIATRRSYGSLPPDLPAYDGTHLAMLEPDWIGEVVLVCKGADCRFGWVVDCAGIADGGYAWMVRGGYAAELDPRSVRALDALGAQIQIYAVPDPDLAGVVPGRGVVLD